MMITLKCRMCGGDLNLLDSKKIAICEYCGSKQTVPDIDDEKKARNFNHANKLRMDNKFDRSAGVYESIITEFPEESEGYWGLVLCTYGIEYVDDEKTGTKIPTCHRTLTSSIMDDENFIRACEYADDEVRSVYREEAKAIGRLQKQIISVVENEEAYDIFICYKENDDITKSRTEDSMLAQDIYHLLEKEGYRVFFARMTLREKAGVEYEPYIYAALRSAKVMLAIGTKFEYYEAAWVKNEWSRYLTMMEDDNTKRLFACYKNLDPEYDIPKEFKNAQALDMSSVTFYGDLRGNILKAIPNKTSGNSVIKTSDKERNDFEVSFDRLIQNGETCLSLGNYSGAESIYVKISREFPEKYQGWWGLIICKTENLTKLAINQENVDMWFEYVEKVADKDYFGTLKAQYVKYLKLVAEKNYANEISNTKICESKINNLISQKEKSIDAVKNSINKEESDCKLKTEKNLKDASSKEVHCGTLSSDANKKKSIGIILAVLASLLSILTIYCFFDVLAGDSSLTGCTASIIGFVCWVLIIIMAFVSIYLWCVCAENITGSKKLEAQIYEQYKEAQNLREENNRLMSESKKSIDAYNLQIQNINNEILELQKKTSLSSEYCNLPAEKVVDCIYAENLTRYDVVYAYDTDIAEKRRVVLDLIKNFSH